MNKSTPKVSIIIPIWNTEKYLEKCLESIVNQTLKDIEIICVNNGSTDSSVQIVEQYAQKDSRIKLVTIKHLGVSGARNAGIAEATAPYLTFVDSDDWIEPEAYKTAVKYFEDPKIDIVCWGAKVITENSKCNPEYINGALQYHKIRLKGKKELNNNIILRNTVCVWNKLFKTDIIRANNIKFPEGVELEDNSFYYTYIVNCKYGYFINKYLYNYLQRENSLLQDIQSQKLNIIAPHIQNLKFIIDYYKNKNLLSDKIPLLLELFNRYLDMDIAWTTEQNHSMVLSMAAALADEIPLSKTQCSLVKNLQERNYQEVLKIINNKPEKIWGNKIFVLYRKNNGMYQLNMLNKKILKFKLKRKG